MWRLVSKLVEKRLEELWLWFIFSRVSGCPPFYAFAFHRRGACSGRRIGSDRPDSRILSPLYRVELLKVDHLYIMLTKVFYFLLQMLPEIVLQTFEQCWLRTKAMTSLASFVWDIKSIKGKLWLPIHAESVNALFTQILEGRDRSIAHSFSEPKWTRKAIFLVQ